MPSRSALSGWLERRAYTDALPAEAGTAGILQVTAQLQGLWRANQALPAVLQRKSGSRRPHWTWDATVIVTHKREALYRYKGFKAYQDLLNRWWAEESVMLYSNLRHGDVLALGHGAVAVSTSSSGICRASSQKKSRRRSHFARHQSRRDLLYCGEGKDPRVIEFAVLADVTEAFRPAVLAVTESDSKPLIGMVEGEPQQTGQEWAERRRHVPDWAGIWKRVHVVNFGDPAAAGQSRNWAILGNTPLIDRYSQPDKYSVRRAPAASCSAW